MNPVSQITPEECQHLIGVFFDIDDTFTLHGKILQEAFSALWELKEAGLCLVPITGRPAGWCDHIARMWPIDGIVGENGAFYFYYDNDKKRLIHRYFLPPDEALKKRSELESIKDEILEKLPGARIASDQPYRLFDLAIDFAEDVLPLTEAEIDEICAIFSRHGAKHKISSIHVNGWFGDYDKLRMAELFVEERLRRDDMEGSFLFIGDSPNDEPMFRAFPLSVGVANLRRFLRTMKYLPGYITEAEGSLGFAEMARTVLEKRSCHTRH
jgi:hypothetical protein